MKITRTVICAVILLGTALSLPSLTAITPTFEPADFIYWGSGQIIMTDNNGVIPNVGDWDHDGDKDILVGTYYYGNVYYYPNTGTNENPIFLTRSQLLADGSPISVTYG